MFLFKKKLTVIGIIGQTQGVSKAANPHKSPIKNISMREASARSSPSLKACSSPITGVHKISLSTGCRLDAAAAAISASVNGKLVASVLFSAIAALSIVPEAVVVEASAAPETVTVVGRLLAPNSKSTGRGGVQVASLHACALTFPTAAKLALSVTFIRCLNVTVFVNEPISI